MMYIRAELHNHSIESDGELSVEELIDYSVNNNFEVLALTDHNTTSGHSKAYHHISKKKYDLECIPGIEVTSFFGHILALGLQNMPDFTDLNPNLPEVFFSKLKAYGAKAVGIAHPFCIGTPISEGCRFEMNINNWCCVDYIEIANTSGPDELLGNTKTLSLWENLVLDGYKICAVSGKDLHSLPNMDDVFLSYAIVENSQTNVSKSKLVLDAIINQQILVTKGPLLYTKNYGKTIEITLDDNDKETDYVVIVKDSTRRIQNIQISSQTSVCVEVNDNAISATVKLYKSGGDLDYKSLVAVTPPIFF